MVDAVLIVVLDARGRPRYRPARPRRDETLAAFCARLGASELRLPVGPRWPRGLAALVAGAAVAPLPPSLSVVRVGEVRLRLGEPLAAAGWRYLVAAVGGRLQAQDTTSTGLPRGSPPACTTASSVAKSSSSPSSVRTASRVGQAQPATRGSRPPGSTGSAVPDPG